MKKTVALLLILSALPMRAGVNCTDNSQQLTEGYDTKERHSIACDCPCTTIRNGFCTECTHLQDAHTYTIISSATKVSTRLPITLPEDPKTLFKELALKYLHNKLTLNK